MSKYGGFEHLEGDGGALSCSVEFGDGEVEYGLKRGKATISKIYK